MEASSAGHPDDSMGAFRGAEHVLVHNLYRHNALTSLLSIELISQRFQQFGRGLIVFHRKGDYIVGQPGLLRSLGDSFTEMVKGTDARKSAVVGMRVPDKEPAERLQVVLSLVRPPFQDFDRHELVGPQVVGSVTDWH